MLFSLKTVDSSDRRFASKRHRRSTAGFAIAEVLVASSLMLAAVSIAGNGAIQLLQSNYKAKADSELRNNVNRTLEFISNEVKRARIIADSPARIVSTHIPTDSRAILAFQIPDPNNPSQPVSEQIVYYVRNRENPWLGPRVLWRYGPAFDDNGNYITPADTTTWTLTPMMDLVVNEANNNNRRDCDPNRPGTLSGWQRLPAEDSQVEGIYACVKQGGSQVILAANVELGMTTTETATYALSNKIATRSSDLPYYLTNSNPRTTDVPAPSASPSPSPDTATATPSSDPAQPTPTVDPTPVFTSTGPDRIVLTQPATIAATALQTPLNSCISASCYVWARDPIAPDDRYTADLTSGATVQANAGQDIVVFVEGLSSSNGTTRNQTVNLYQFGDTLPSSLPNITLTRNQVLVAITNRRSNPNKTYVVLVNITPRS